MINANDAEINVNDLPTVWTKDIYLAAKQKKPWLICEGGYLGCTVCRSVKAFGNVEKQGRGVNISAKFADCKVEFNGTNRKTQLASLRKKLREHMNSDAHKAALKQSEIRDIKPIKRKFEQSFSHLSEHTCRVFRTAYKTVKHARPFSNFDSDIELQQLNGLNMGRVLHSDVTCANIASHIASNMRKSLLKICMETSSKFSVLLDESTSLSKKSCLIVYLRAVVSEKSPPITFFLDLVELENSSASGIKQALLSCLTRAGFDENYCQKNWLAICTDGCSTMLGKKSGLVAQLKQQFKSLISWHCVAHRLELAVGDALKDVTETNHFKIFLEKLYSLYSLSPKNQRELATAAESLDTQILKIGKIFTIRWVASSVRTVKAVWQNYPALHKHFTDAAVDPNRNLAERNQFQSLADHLASPKFVKNLALMYDCLHELSLLSQELQKNDISIHSAHNRICLTRQLFVSLKSKRGRHEKQLDLQGDLIAFQGIQLREKRGVLEINRSQFIQSLIDHLDDRMFTSIATKNAKTETERDFYSQILRDINILDKSQWSAEEMADPSFGDESIENLCHVFKIDQEAMIRGFQAYVFSGGNDSMKDGIFPLLQAINTVPVQTAECERGFSAMNRILTPQRASLSLPRLTDCLFLYTTGPPLSLFNPDPYVKSWLHMGRHSADDSNALAKKPKTFEDHPFLPMWKLLQVK